MNKQSRDAGWQTGGKMSKYVYRLIGACLAGFMATVAVPASAASTAALIDEAMHGAHRSDAYKARNTYRHPKETLLFFGLKPDMTVVEITPGGGWYSEILAPVLRDNGKYYAASYRITEKSPDFFRRMDKNYRAKLASAPQIYDKVELVHFDAKAPVFAPDGSADMVLTFRNVHNWAKSGRAELMFAGFAKALKPGGILGVVEHRARPGTPFDQQVKSGYMTEEYVIKTARKAGFRLLEKSQVNANDKDTTDHPGGVWNLPPNLRGVPDADIAKMRAIGESDRMTLKFVVD
jgi:predicted methyltransferase